jgi:hypothetical protein
MEYRAKNKERISIKNKEYWEKTKGTEKQREINSSKCETYRKKNPEKFRHYSNKRRSQKLNAIPQWADLEKIQEFYHSCPEGYHVDHVIPLQGKIVCGLHVIENLQYLTAIENHQKSNRYAVE